MVSEVENPTGGSSLDLESDDDIVVGKCIKEEKITRQDGKPESGKGLRHPFYSYILVKASQVP